MNPALIAALISQIAVPELARWLASLHASGQVITDEMIIEKLGTDADKGIAIGQAWLAANPPPPPNPA